MGTHGCNRKLNSQIILPRRLVIERLRNESEDKTKTHNWIDFGAKSWSRFQNIYWMIASFASSSCLRSHFVISLTLFRRRSTAKSQGMITRRGNILAAHVKFHTVSFSQSFGRILMKFCRWLQISYLLKTVVYWANTEGKRHKISGDNRQTLYHGWDHLWNRLPRS